MVVMHKIRVLGQKPELEHRGKLDRSREERTGYFGLCAEGERNVVMNNG
jgi:hypothetical protein